MSRIKGSPMDNKREHTRHALSVNIKISHADIGVKTVKTRDVSDGGVFVLTELVEALMPGCVVEGQVQDMMADAPVLKMEVVRVEKAGLGLRYLLDDLPLGDGS